MFVSARREAGWALRSGSASTSPSSVVVRDILEGAFSRPKASAPAPRNSRATASRVPLRTDNGSVVDNPARQCQKVQRRSFAPWTTAGSDSATKLRTRNKQPPIVGFVVRPSNNDARHGRECYTARRRSAARHRYGGSQPGLLGGNARQLKHRRARAVTSYRGAKGAHGSYT